MNHDFDLVIVGAGIVGTFAAYLATQNGANLRILLIDRSIIGCGTTQHSLGLDYAYGSTPLKQTMTKESVRMWDALSNTLCDLQRSVPLYGLVSNQNLSKVTNGLLDKPHIHTDIQGDLQPMLQADQVVLSGIQCKYNHTREITLDLARRFVAASEKNTIWEGISVTDINRESTGFSVTLSGHPAITTKKILLTMGPWFVHSPFVRFFDKAQVRTKKIVSLFIDKKPSPDDPAFFFFDEDAFLLPIVESSRFMFSFTVYKWDCDVLKTTFEIKEDERAQGSALLQKYMPNFVPYCHGGRAFCDAYHHDWTPFISSSEVDENIVVATGGSGSGFRLAPSMAARALHRLGIS